MTRVVTLQSWFHDELKKSGFGLAWAEAGLGLGVAWAGFLSVGLAVQNFRTLSGNRARTVEELRE